MVRGLASDPRGRERRKEGRKEDEANNYNRRSLERGKREINLGS